MSMAEALSPATAPNAPRPLSRGRKLFYVITLVVSCILLFMFYAMGMRFFLVPSESMEPGLMPNDYLVTFRAKEYHRGDVIVLYDPLDQTAGSYLVKRVVATAGDKVRIEGGALFLNGAYASEPYIAEPMRYDFLVDEDKGTDVTEYTVPENEILVLGDNRNHSEDGSSKEWRTIGVYQRPSVPVDSVVGRVYGVYLPWSRSKKVLHFPLRNAEGN